MKQVSLFLADGFEDIEALATRDILLRGGVDVLTVSLNDDPLVTSAHGLQVFADTCLDDFLDDEADGNGYSETLMIFPGGMPGSKNLGDCAPLMELMNRRYTEGAALAAICAAPGYVLSHLDDVAGQTFTCYDGVEQMLIDKGARFVRQPAVVSGRIITGRGPGHVTDFALTLLAFLEGQAAADRVARAMTLPCA